MPLRRGFVHRRDRIPSAPAPGIAAADPPDAEPRAAKKSMHLVGLGEKLRAARREPAPRARTRDPVEQRRNRELVNLLEQACEKFHGANRAGWNRAAQAASTPPQARKMARRRKELSRRSPAKVPQSFAVSPRGQSRAASAGRDFARLHFRLGGSSRSRSAGPAPRHFSKRREASRAHAPAFPRLGRAQTPQPARDGLPLEIAGAASDCPAPWSRRRGALAAACSGLGVPGEMNLDALRHQPLPATLAAAAQDGATVLGRHPLAEAELLFASALGRLVGAFHDRKVLSKRARRIAAKSGVSTNPAGSFRAIASKEEGI